MCFVCNRSYPGLFSNSNDHSTVHSWQINSSRKDMDTGFHSSTITHRWRSTGKKVAVVLPSNMREQLIHINNCLVRSCPFKLHLGEIFSNIAKVTPGYTQCQTAKHCLSGNSQVPGYPLQLRILHDLILQYNQYIKISGFKLWVKSFSQVPYLKLRQSICLNWVRPCILNHNMVHVFPIAQRRQTLMQQAFQNQGEVTRFFRKSKDQPLSRQKIETHSKS